MDLNILLSSFVLGECNVQDQAPICNHENIDSPWKRRSARASTISPDTQLTFSHNVNPVYIR